MFMFSSGVHKTLNENKTGFGFNINYLTFQNKYKNNYDANGNPIDDLKTGTLEINAGAALAFRDNFRGGLGYSLMLQSLGKKVFGLNEHTVTMGLIYDVTLKKKSTLSLGGSFRNTIADGYTGYFNAGLAWQHVKGFKISGSVEPATDRSFYLNLSSSYTVKNNKLAFIPSVGYRQGLNSADGGSINAGLSIILSLFKADIGFSYAHEISQPMFGGSFSLLLDNRFQSLTESGTVNKK